MVVPSYQVEISETFTSNGVDYDALASLVEAQIKGGVRSIISVGTTGESPTLDAREHIDVINDEFFVACLDLGHAEMKGLETSAVELIHALDYRLQALHIHDNDRWHDSHQIPFSMDMDFEAIAKALSDIGYSGYLTLEADRYLGAFNEDNVFEGIKNLAESVKRISDMMEDK